MRAHYFIVRLSGIIDYNNTINTLNVSKLGILLFLYSLLKRYMNTLRIFFFFFVHDRVLLRDKRFPVDAVTDKTTISLVLTNTDNGKTAYYLIKEETLN